METVIQELVRRTRLSTPKDIASFHTIRQEAFKVASATYEDRSVSYNVDHEPMDEMPFGAVSLASEIYKRAIRMTGILTPLRETSLRMADLERLLDSCIDIMVYASWQYALVSIATQNILKDEDENEQRNAQNSDNRT